MTKEEFTKMINSEDYTYQDEQFYLERWTTALNKNVDFLRICLKPINGRELCLTRIIRARDYEDAMIEITTAIAELYAEAGKELAKRFKNGAM